ncbi:transcription initiation factor TFIID subunit 4-like isoform X2 [Canis lupus familiaris]|uniref:transcription initiation factor TFIID subunit 4-like isoform X2 n=1 Tax=Canis lupus familiaris TaxID=9615 RepID=UPI0018F2B359|nr:transcription initiation factor TFIID subunit 4-like isoform X2 [Canis lupus familiaris]
MVGGPAGVLSASSRSEPEPLGGCQPEIRPRRVIKHRPGPGPASFPSLGWPGWQVGRGDKGQGLWGPQLCAPCPLPGQEHGVGAGQCQPSTCRDPRVPTMPVGPAREGLRRLPERPRQGAGGAPGTRRTAAAPPGPGTPHRVQTLQSRVQPLPTRAPRAARTVVLRPPLLPRPAYKLALGSCRRKGKAQSSGYWCVQGPLGPGPAHLAGPPGTSLALAPPVAAGVPSLGCTQAPAPFVRASGRCHLAPGVVSTGWAGF